MTIISIFLFLLLLLLLLPLPLPLPAFLGSVLVQHHQYEDALYRKPSARVRVASSTKEDNENFNRTNIQSDDDVAAVYNLLRRVLADPNDADQHFVFVLCHDKDPSTTTTTTTTNTNTSARTSKSSGCSCSPPDPSTTESNQQYGWFCMEKKTRDVPLTIMATSVNELSYGLGYYFRYYCNFSLGWNRIGGRVRRLSMMRISNRTDSADTATASTDWPALPRSNPLIRKQRRLRWSYLMNVCTHSYSLVWYDATSWEAFLDWASLMGINNILALSGQEEIQYKVFRQCGLRDMEIRSWFNGPAFLTWSRGQNEYGSNIAGPLPRSWMQKQWKMQKEIILPRLRELNIVGQLPGFQGNVPIQLANLFPNSTMKKMQDTGWLDALDPLYTEIADLWMTTMINDFGRDYISHWYQLDGYLNGGVPPWILDDIPVIDGGDDSSAAAASGGVLDGNNYEKHDREENVAISAIEHRSLYDNTAGLDNESITPTRDELWYQRGVAAFTGLNRTDPDAVWSFQGFAFHGWNDSDITASWLRGFVESTPPGRFVIIDMAYKGLGEWTKWNNASYFGADFIWSALHNFGDTNGLKGDLKRIASIIPIVERSTSSMAGIGATPEGIDQNPVYYEFLYDQVYVFPNETVIPDVATALVERAYRRYGGLMPSHASYGHVTKAWQLLARSSYANDGSVQDLTGVAHIQPGDSNQFEKDRFTPEVILCDIYNAWKEFLVAAEVAPPKSQLSFQQAPFTYDLIDTGREVLAQLSQPMALNFSDALAKNPLDADLLQRTGSVYLQLLLDLDYLVGTHQAFLLSPWLESARQWSSTGKDSDCSAAAVSPDDVKDCSHFYEWNARVQITTWNPVTVNATRVPGGPIDYAAKHWNGLIRDYYAQRLSIILNQALWDAGKTGVLNESAVAFLEARFAYKWATSQNKYSLEPSADPLHVSEMMEETYGRWFQTCSKYL